MPGLARIPLLVTAIGLAAVVGACGTDDTAAKNDYVKQLNAAQTQFAVAATEVKRENTQTSTARQDRRALDRYLGTLDTVVGALRTIKVPGSVRAEHGRFVAVITGLRSEVSRIISRLRSPTTPVLAEIQRDLSAATVTFNERISAATDAINAKLRSN